MYFGSSALGSAFLPTYAEICLALGAVILGLAAQYPPAPVRRVPAVVAGQRRALPRLRIMDPHESEKLSMIFHSILAVPNPHNY